MSGKFATRLFFPRINLSYSGTYIYEKQSISHFERITHFQFSLLTFEPWGGSSVCVCVSVCVLVRTEAKLQSSFLCLSCSLRMISDTHHALYQTSVALFSTITKTESGVFTSAEINFFLTKIASIIYRSNIFL